MNYLPSLRTLHCIWRDLASLSAPCRRLSQQLLAAVLPQRCGLCAGYAGRWPVCINCESTLPRLPPLRCPRCADTSATGDICARCLGHPVSFDTTIAAFAYAKPVDDQIHALKYGHQLHIAAWLGHRLADAVADPAALASAWVVAVPLHPDRLRERGFNQATEIARPLARRLGARIRHDIAQRIRATPAQAQLALTDREQNVRGAFQCSADLAGRTIVVVDDVMTSGASVRELSRVLRLHGAGRIVVAIAARSLHD